MRAVRRALPLLLAVVAAASPATAAPAPQVTDPAGDWGVASQDVLWARLSSTGTKAAPVLRGELRLAAAPAPGTTSRYWLGFHVGCVAYRFTYVWSGAPQGSGATLEEYSYCAGTAAPVRNPVDRTYPVTVAVKGTTVVWQAAYAGAIRRGARAGTFYVFACVPNCGVRFVNTSSGREDEVLTGDVAESDARYVIGSDLPRR